MDTNTGITKETLKSPVQFSRMYESEFQKEGTLTVEISQEVLTKTSYPSKKTTSSLQDGLFSNDEFGFKPQVFESKEKRMAWILVPVATSEDVAKGKVVASNANGSCIYRVLSNEPILDENQKYAVNEGLRSKDHYADSQAVRYPENNQTIADGTNGKLVLDANSNPQYRRTFFSSIPREDVDLRDAGKVFLSEAIAVELQGATAVIGQNI